MISLKKTGNDDPDFISLVEKLNEDLWNRYGSVQFKYLPHNKIESIATVIVAYAGGIAVGCGCFRIFEKDTVEIKRMFVEKNNRGKGIAITILKELESWAKELHYSTAVLETGKGQPEAIALYKNNGYSVIENYRPYIDMDESICMKKTLM